MAEGTFKDLQVAGELKEFITKSPDVTINANIKMKLLNFGDKEVLVVTKKILSPTEILDVMPLDEKETKDIFSSFASD